MSDVAPPPCRKAPPPSTCRSKTATSPRAPTAPCTDGGRPKVLLPTTHPSVQGQIQSCLRVFNSALLVRVCACVYSDTGYEETLNAVTMPMVNNDMCSQIKGDAGESRICAGGKRGEGVCDVRARVSELVPAKSHFCCLFFSEVSFSPLSPPERQRRSAGLPGARAQSHRGR